jgi:catechol 2,3-dioxygenase-like lactoylglutathione lyase family enzyme
MRIDTVQLPVPDPRASAAFHRDVLGLPVSPGREGVVVRIGWSRLVLVPDPGADPSTQHLAITVPGDAGAAAHDWLAARTALLGRDGTDRFEAGPDWNAESTYFESPDGTVLELIARRRRPERLGRAAFGPQHLLGLSEVGVPVPSVAEARRRLTRGPGLAAFGGPGSETFGAVGDDEGLLVLVAPERPWFPTADHRARPARLVVELSGTEGRGEVRLNADTLVTYA